MKAKDIELPNYTPVQEFWNSATHGLGTVLTLIFGPFLLIKAAKTGDAWSIVGCSIFVFALLCLYTFSCLYHGLHKNTGKKVLRVMDHDMSRYEREDWDRFVSKIHLSLQVPFIHITGSNGKGSTAKYLYEIYKAAGYKTALFSKPYLHRVNEMMLINDEMIKDEDFAKIFSQKESEIRAANLSSFEIETYIAFAYFNAMKPDIAIIECGMGGATDSTTLVGDVPLLSIITTISLEHTAFLGRTVSEIALNKGGIIAREAPVLVGKLEESATNVLKDLAKRAHSLYYEVDDFHNEVYEAPYYRFEYKPYQNLEILTPARYQLSNASMAVEATKLLQNRFPVTEDAVRHDCR